MYGLITLRCSIFARKCKTCKREDENYCKLVDCDCPCQYGDESGRCACVCHATETEIRRNVCAYYEAKEK